MEGPCLARMNVTVESGGTVKLWYASGHTGHKPGLEECKFLPLSASSKDIIVQKLSMGVTIERVLEG